MARALTLSFVLAVLAGCTASSDPDDAGGRDAAACQPGTSGTRTACRSDADCAGASGPESCLPPGAGPGCGICSTPMALCATDPDCPEGLVCVSRVEGCPSCEGGGPPISTRCEPRCTEGGCLPGFTCLGDGHCAPLQCRDDDFACPSPLVCVETGGDEHGCALVACSSDANCECGQACVQGTCHDALGQCTPPSA